MQLIEFTFRSEIFKGSKDSMQLMGTDMLHVSEDISGAQSLRKPCSKLVNVVLWRASPHNLLRNILTIGSPLRWLSPSLFRWIMYHEPGSPHTQQYNRKLSELWMYACICMCTNTRIRPTHRLLTWIADKRMQGSEINYWYRLLGL